MADEITGDGPCMYCNWFHERIILTGKTSPALDGGKNWEIAPGQVCNCGGVMDFLHEPNPETMKFILPVSVEKEISCG